jgi:hypothetical protein
VEPLIPNARLLKSDVPDIDARVLESARWQDEDDPRWQQLWQFASTFDGYRYFGADDAVAERLAAFDDSVRDAFFTHGRLPAIDLALLRACLFYESRRLLNATWEAPIELDKDYLHVLLVAIREAID